MATKKSKSSGRTSRERAKVRAAGRVSTTPPEAKAKIPERVTPAVASPATPDPVPTREARGYPCLKVVQNDFEIYLLTVPVNDLFPWCVIAPYEATEDHPGGGFQRVLDLPRAKSIAHYVTEARGCIPQTIVLFSEDAAELEYDSSAKMVRFNRVAGAFAVGDGQHRLWGLYLAQKESEGVIRVLVSLVANASSQEAARIFLDVNTRQKGLPTALVTRVKELAGTESARETTLRVLFDRLAADPASPLCGRVSLTRNAPGRLSPVAFNRALGPALASASLASLDEERRYRLVRTYLAALEAQIRARLPAEERARLVQAGFFAAIGAVLPDVLACVARDRSLGRDAFEAVVGPLVALPVTHDGRALPLNQRVAAMRDALRGTLDLAGVA